MKIQIQFTGSQLWLITIVADCKKNNSFLKKGMIFSLFTTIIFSSCSKKEVVGTNSSINSLPSLTAAVPCDNRPVINARLVPIGTLSKGRTDLMAGTAGNKILFAGGYANATMGHVPSTRVDVYDITTNSWSIAELRTNGEREGITVASVGNKILFAGGIWPFDGTATSMVDIYDASTNTWSAAELSEARTGIATATLGNKVFFAGGGYRNTTSPFSWGNSNVVDIYDYATNTWTTSSLSVARNSPSATTVGNEIYFAGGITGFNNTLAVSKTIDVFNAATNTWSTSRLHEPKAAMNSIAVGNTIFWAGGYNSYSSIGWLLSNSIEIRDLVSGVSSFACMIPRAHFSAVVKDDNIVFFTGYGNDPRNGTHFEIFNTTTNTWSTGVLNQKINGAAIIAVNNTIYVAGGTDGAGGYFDQVWKLEF